VSTCPICRPGWSDRALLELDASWLVSSSGPSVLPGYCAVFTKRHVIEPFELSPAERSAWWNDCMVVASAVKQVFHAAKMNYEIHGNTIEHLHLHVFPRFAGDAFEGRAIEPREPPRYENDADQVAELKRTIVRIRATV
jgi:diadenosine tetraphosphate (Ap4A) HIT family hydrolase